ncbi:MAG: phospholipase D-like domain-containing protein, partial [Endozoicomonadaceae bacterium]|nr:phospholipase D-like domain-containing protein [Endozoicomonadaceae bacterium]
LKSKIAYGVKVRVIIPPPERNVSMGKEESTMVAEKLELEGILVEFRANIHQKAVLIDDDIAWFGSLNPLSFSGGTEESMLRIEQEKITGTFACSMAVNRKLAKEDPVLMVARELPDCFYCGGKIVFHRGKYGPWVKCRSCNEKKSLKGF